MSTKSLKEDTFSQGTDTLQNVPNTTGDLSDEDKVALSTKTVFQAGQGLDMAVRNLDRARGPGDKDSAYKTVEIAQNNYEKARANHKKLTSAKESLIREDLSQHEAFGQGKKLKASLGGKHVAMASKAHEIHSRNAAVAQSHAKAMKSLESQGKSGTSLHSYHAEKHTRHSELSDKFNAFSQGLKS